MATRTCANCGWQNYGHCSLHEEPGADHACDHWRRDRWTCHCDEPGQMRYSLGIYAGVYCDACWEHAGYRKEGPRGFNHLDAGEYYGPEDY